ncbi:unnamed protein product [Candida verbasci]|uniref:Magnesium transporter n=1 Tax=Candida verbasci TaxID=1227364 RepID=A0A9W4TRM8_9ASCO|nr:unnamed protein product [Candida verbasci]
MLARLNTYHLPKLSSIFYRYNSTIYNTTNNKLPNKFGPPFEIPNHLHKKIKPIQPNDHYVSCTIFNQNGKITAVSKKYPKMLFLKNNHLFPRDLRKIDTSSIDVVPVIMIRESNAILVNLLHIKAIIKKDSVMVFDTSNSEIAKRLGIFMYDLELKLQSKTLLNSKFYEFRALETILISVMNYLEIEIKSYSQQCGLILSELEDEVDRSKLQKLLIKSKKLSSFHQKAILIRNVLEDLLENDEDLSGMYLTNPKTYNANTDLNDFEDLENILESYYRHCDEFVQQAGSLLNDIKATEEIINIILDTNRNSLMLFELKITVYTLGFTVATLLPAFYGMNLKNYIEDSNLGFGIIIVLSVIQGACITWFNFKKLHKVQKLTMMNNGLMIKPQRSFNYKLPLKKLFFGRGNKQFDRPTNNEKDVIWRMINDDKPLK